MRRSPGVVERPLVAQHVWDNEADAFGSNTIDVHLARLRSKLAGAGVRIEPCGVSATGSSRREDQPRGPGRGHRHGDHRRGLPCLAIVLNLVVSAHLTEQDNDGLAARLGYEPRSDHRPSSASGGAGNRGSGGRG